MLICDHCNQGYHMSCLQPPLKEVPDDDWYCPQCAKRRSAPTAQDIINQRATMHQQEVTHDLPNADFMVCMVLLASKQQGVRMTELIGNQLIEECNPTCEQGLHSARSPAELEKEQRALIVRFVRECNPVQRREVHATSNSNILKEWIWEMLCHQRVPDTMTHESTT